MARSSPRPGRRRAPSAPVRRRRATVTVALVVLAVGALWFHAARSDAKRLVPGRTPAPAGQTADGGTPVAAALFNPIATPSQMPGALIEPLFITDPFEGSIAVTPAGRQAIATGLAQAVAQYFAPPAPSPTTT